MEARTELSGLVFNFFSFDFVSVCGLIICFREYKVCEERKSKNSEKLICEAGAPGVPGQGPLAHAHPVTDPLGDLGPQTSTSPERLSPDFAEELRSSEPSLSPGLLEEDGEVAMVLLGRPSPGAVDPEEVATLCSSCCALRLRRQGLARCPPTGSGCFPRPGVGALPAGCQHLKEVPPPQEFSILKRSPPPSGGVLAAN